LRAGAGKPDWAVLRARQGSFNCWLNGPTNNSFLIQKSPNLLNWFPVSTNTIPASGSVLASDTNSVFSSRQFYRATLQVPNPFLSALQLYLSLDSRDTVGAVAYNRAGPPFYLAAVYNAPMQTVGQVFEGLSFDGSTQYLETPALNLYTSTATFLAWVKRNGAQIDYAGIVFCRGGSTTSGLDCGASGDLRYHWNDEAGTYNYRSGLIPPDGQWALAALVVTPARRCFTWAPPTASSKPGPVLTRMGSRRSTRRWTLRAT